MEASALHAPVGIGRVSIAAPLLRLRSDDQLVALFRAGNEEAFRVIHDRYRQRLFAYTRQMMSGSRSDAEDALQDVFIRAYAALRADSRPVMLRAWLYRVAHNRCIDQLRRPTPAPAEVFEMSRGPLADPIEQTERRQDLAQLVADVRRLPEQQRSALLMREMEGLSYAQLASALDVSVPAVKSLLVRARVSLVEAIEARDTDCVEIQHDIAAAMDRGVRANGRVRRHVRECSGCKDYNTRLRGIQRSFNELSPGHGPIGFLAKVFGIGGAGTGAAAGGTAAGGGAAAVGSRRGRRLGNEGRRDRVLRRIGDRRRGRDEREDLPRGGPRSPARRPQHRRRLRLRLRREADHRHVLGRVGASQRRGGGGGQARDSRAPPPRHVAAPSVSHARRRRRRRQQRFR